jgi:hypothetical protein
LADGRLGWQTPDRRNYRIRDLATGIYAISYSYAGPGIVRVSSKTGAQQRIEHFPFPLQATGCDLTPKRDAIVCSIADEKSEAWMMQDFDPDVR